MSDKIWFVYITDHHEGPFSQAEVQAKIADGTVSAESLVWKDGMPEWVQLDSVDELQALLQGGAPAAAPAAAAGDASGSPLDLVNAAQVEAEAEANEQLGVDSGAATATAATQQPMAAAQTAAVGDTDKVWVVCVGDNASGLHSKIDLAGLQAAGQLAGSMVWRPGMTDFQAFEAVTELQALPAATGAPAAGAAPAQQATGMMNPGIARQDMTNPGFRNPGLTNPAIQRPAAGFAKLPPGAELGDDEPTDPDIQAPKKGFMDKLKGMFARKKKKDDEDDFADQPQSNLTKPGLKNPNINVGAAGGRGKRGKKKEAPKSNTMRFIVYGALLVTLAGGGGWFWYTYLYNPYADMQDVKPEDMEAMKEIAGASGAPRFYFAQALGDQLNPTFYVVANLDPGVVIKMDLRGRIGTLNKKMSFNMTESVSLDKRRLAKFGPLDDNGAPLPMGFYDITFSYGSMKLEKKNYFIGNKGIYDRRIGPYKEKIQKAYDNEVTELREVLNTIKSAKADFDERLETYLTERKGNPVQAKARWTSFTTGQRTMVQQMKINIDSIQSDPGFKDRYYKDEVARMLTAVNDFESYKVIVEKNNFDMVQGEVVTARSKLDEHFQYFDDFIAKAAMTDPFKLAAEAQNAGGSDAAAAADEATNEAADEAAGAESEVGAEAN